MKTVWERQGERQEVTAPISLIVSAFAPVTDVRETLTPQLRTDLGDTDLILIDLSPFHNSPSFRRSSDNTYARLVYAGKSSDVTDVMVNGKWLMRDRQLLTIQEEELLAEAADLAKKIDAFLIGREESVLSKLIALGGSSEEESFEVQIKAKIAETDPIIEALMQNDIDILYERHYRQHDAYFFFEDESQGCLRYREDDYIENDRSGVAIKRNDADDLVIGQVHDVFAIR